MKAFKSYFAPAKQKDTALQNVKGEKSEKKKTKHGQAHSDSSSVGDRRTSSLAPSGLGPQHSTNTLSRYSNCGDLRADVTVHSLWQDQLRRLYATSLSPWEGAILKKGRNDFVCAPADIRNVRNGLFDLVCQLNVSCAITMNTPVIQSIIRGVVSSGSLPYIPLMDGLRLQVLAKISDLPRCHKHQFAAFVLEPPLLVVWDDEADRILERAEGLEKNLIRYIWQEGGDEESGDDEKASPAEVTVDEITPSSLEEGKTEDRPVRLTSPVIVGMTLGLSVVCLGLGWRSLALQTMVDGDFKRLALVAVSPLTMFISLFFFLIIICDIFQIIGPISSLTSNSKNYSGQPPRRLNREHQDLPHITIQMPVYKESLAPVIRPTVISLKAAISTYELQGGTANIFVNDDGMQLLPADEALGRKEFYEEHNIGWVSRPAHNPKPEDESVKPFLRRGRFKKASNMNYCLMVSNRIEEKLKGITRGDSWSQESEDRVYTQALAQVLQEDEGRTWAEGNVRVGDYVLLIDSDTRVPRDCLLDAVSEMDASPEIAILQYSSGVMNVTESFFERAVTWFTQLIYTSIKFAVANGDIPPFVGHNAILRWSAIQDAGSYTDEDGYEKFWSESHVSEDFDMALRLQTAGYSLRFGTYPGDGFKEGVSLTVYDELARWEKYAFGVNELLFHPFRLWFVRGPFTPLFRRFLMSNIAFYRKITIMGYIGTYYAIGASWILTLMNYFLTGWLFGFYDKYYLDSFAIYFSIIIVFPLAGNIALAVLRYRLGEQSFLPALWNNFKWIPLFSIFLGGISLHVSKALLCHFFEINIQWGATSKEVEHCNFLEEIPKIIKSFWGTFLFCFLMTGLLVAGYFFFPREWQIKTFASIYPLASVTICHFALPVLLNPALMKFTW